MKNLNAESFQKEYPEAANAKQNIDTSEKSRWYTGPEFLTQSDDHWPKKSLLNEEPKEVMRNIHQHY